jgi:hypothetical protein
VFFGKWRLRGYDTFAGEFYEIEGRWTTRKKAERAAKRELRKLERLQPSHYSGGQAPGGIQDQVYVVSPEGAMERCLPEGVRDLDVNKAMGEGSPRRR